MRPYRGLAGGGADPILSGLMSSETLSHHAAALRAELTPPLVLQPVTGAETDPVVIRPDTPATIGRSRTCAIRMDDGRVSRLHAALFHHGGTWFVTDLASRHGTTLNGVSLRAHSPAPLREGDILAVEPRTFRVSLGGATTTGKAVATVDDASRAGGRVESAPAGAELHSLAKHRLQLLMDFAAVIHSADTEQDLTQAVLSALAAGTGCSNAALLRDYPGSDEVEVIAHRSSPERSVAAPDPTPAASTAPVRFEFSKSLIRAAREGEVVRLRVASESDISHSLAGLNIRSAVCAPVMIGQAAAAYLYLDERGSQAGTGPGGPDAVAFTAAVAKMCGLALSNLRRRDLESRQQRLELDLLAAREAQRQILPPEHGGFGPLRYSMRMRPGRLIAGDLFDFVPIDTNRVGVFIGDVTGKGIGAGIFMATVQTQLRLSLRALRDPAAAVAEVSAALAAREPDENGAGRRFVTLWVGVFDLVARVLTYVDAGHGHWRIVSGGGGVERVSGPSGLLAGFEPDHEYEPGQLALAPGMRFVLYSDGLIEHRAATGEAFGPEGVAAVLGSSVSAKEDVEMLFDALDGFCGTEARTDDVTVASIEFAE